MIVITGAAGFIGSCLVAFLNENNFNDLVLVDDFSNPSKKNNWQYKRYTKILERDQWWEWLDLNADQVEIIIHLGARTDTTEFNQELLNKLNTNYSKKVWNKCVEHNIPLIYASSAATYGDGYNGYSDRLTPENLHPLNPYGKSKNDFDAWALVQEKSPFFWAGLKFFNVYGPNEYHKGRMASVIFHAYRQIKEQGKIRLFQSHRDGIGHGEQKRDFIYVKDVCEIIFYLMTRRPNVNGLLNVGTGRARSFNDLANAVFDALGTQSNIEYIPTPEDIREKYQYFTEADISKLRETGYTGSFTSLEEGVADYVKQYLIPEKYW